MLPGRHVDMRHEAIVLQGARPAGHPRCRVAQRVHACNKNGSTGGPREKGVSAYPVTLFPAPTADPPLLLV